MMIVVSVLIFTGALVAAIATIAMMIAPQWRRILHLATGHVEPAFTPLATLVVAERRIAVRRWAAGSPAPAMAWRRRAASCCRCATRFSFSASSCSSICFWCAAA